jgi:hypothetical protein
MSFRTVSVAVLELGSRGCPHRDDLDVERQIDSGERMIGVEQHLIAVDRLRSGRCRFEIGRRP